MMTIHGHADRSASLADIAFSGAGMYCRSICLASETMKVRPR